MSPSTDTSGAAHPSTQQTVWHDLEAQQQRMQGVVQARFQRTAEAVPVTLQPAQAQVVVQHLTQVRNEVAAQTDYEQFERAVRHIASVEARAESQELQAN